MSHAEKWKRLLSSDRINDVMDSKFTNHNAEDIRNPFERDADRILYSYPFRRLQDKTQVVPLPEIDFVHTRLTHTLEVATVGQSIGRIIEKALLEGGDIKEDQKGYIPSILYAACLAHDIGNPPFGHSGEDSISSFFQSKTSGLSNSERRDLESFEGNAMGFRILTSYEDKSLNITCATLAAFSKYPRASFIDGEDIENLKERWDKERISQKKYGFFQEEQKKFKNVAENTGLVNLKDGAWCRHPLAFLLEAADDICYRIIDLEDGVRMKLIPFSDAERYLLRIAECNKGFKPLKYEGLKNENQKFTYMRANAISLLIEECCNVFKTQYSGIMSGSFDKELISRIDSDIISQLDAIKRIIINNVYDSFSVLSLETTGYHVIGQLLERYTYAVDKSDNKAKKYLALLPEEYRPNPDDNTLYKKYLKIASYVAGMTDSFALNTYQKIAGIKV